MKAIQVSITIIAPYCCPLPNILFALPINGGNIAPPTRPIIIKLEISFLRLGFDSRACEKIIANRLEIPSPMAAVLK